MNSEKKFKGRFLLVGIISIIGSINILKSINGFNIFSIVGYGLGIGGLLLLIKGIKDYKK